MRGESSMDDVLTMAKQNLEAMGQQKQAAYRQGTSGIKADKTVLDLKNVDQAVNDAIGMATFKTHRPSGRYRRGDRLFEFSYGEFSRTSFRCRSVR